MRKLHNRLLNVALLGIALFALDRVSERLDGMTRTAQSLAQQVNYSGPMASIPSGSPEYNDR